MLSDAAAAGPQFVGGALVDEVTGPLNAAQIAHVRAHWLRVTIGWPASREIGRA